MSSLPPDQVVEVLLGFLRSDADAGGHGISILDLFDRLRELSNHCLDSDSQAWKALIIHPEVLVEDIRQLGIPLEDVLNSEVGETVLRYLGDDKSVEKQPRPSQNVDMVVSDPVMSNFLPLRALSTNIQPSDHQSSRQESPTSFASALSNKDNMPPKLKKFDPKGSASAASFTSYEDMRRIEHTDKLRAGVPGVYINPEGSVRPKEKKPGRPPKSTILVFKSNKLKDALASYYNEGDSSRTTSMKRRLEDNNGTVPTRDPKRLAVMSSNGIPSTPAQFQSQVRLAHYTPSYQSPFDILPIGQSPAYRSPYAQNLARVEPAPNPPVAMQFSIELDGQMKTLSASSYISPYLKKQPIASLQNHKSILSAYKIPQKVAGLGNSFQHDNNSFSQTAAIQTNQTTPSPVLKTTKIQRKRKTQVSKPPVHSSKPPQPQLIEQDIQVSHNFQSNDRIVTPIETTRSTIEPSQPSQPITEPIKDNQEIADVADSLSHETEALNSTKMAPKIPKQPRKPKAKPSDPVLPEDEEFVNSLKPAEDATLVGFSARLPTKYKDIVGNLVLSEEKEVVFLPLGETLLESAIFSSKATKLLGNPITSVAGSRPMEIQIKIKNEDQEIENHRFQFAPTKTTLRAANNMRSKILTAMMKTRLRNRSATEPSLESEANIQELENQPEEELKPFVCENCQGRWRNLGGLEYHQNKASTACNPNFDPSTFVPAKRGRKKQPRSAPRKRLRRSSPDLFDEYHLLDPFDESEKSSDDSDSAVELVKTVAEIQVSRRNSVLNEGLQGTRLRSKEANVLQELLEDATKQNHLIMPAIPDPESMSVDGVVFDDLWKIAHAKEVILELVATNNNIFPGDRSLWFCFVYGWLKKYAHSGVRPGFKMYTQARNELVGSGLLNSINIELKDSVSRTKQRQILITPGASIESPNIEALKKNLQDSLPEYYLPPEFAPPQDILDKLLSLSPAYSKGQPNNGAKANAHSAEELSKVLSAANAINTDGLLDTFVNDSGDVYTTSHDKLYDPSILPENEKLRRLEFAKRIKLPLTGDERRRALKGPDTQPKISDVSDQVKVLDHASVALRKPIGYLQAANGAWNQVPDTWQPFVPAEVKECPPASALDVRKSTHRQANVGLPEPLTWMQSKNGAWNLKPYGHGVKCVFARPVPKDNGKPGLNFYLETIYDIHRPVCTPTLDRIYISSAREQGIRMALITRKWRANFAILYDNADTDTDQEKKRERRSLRLRLDTVPIQPEETEVVEKGNRQSRTSQRAAMTIEEEDNEDFLPKKNKPTAGLSKNPGLGSLPFSFGLGGSYTTYSPVESSKFPSALHFYAPNTRLDSEENKSKPEYHIKNFKPAYRKQRGLKWHEDIEYSVENLPYNVLESEDEHEGYAIERRVTQNKLGKRLKLREDFPARFLTAVPADFVGVQGNPSDLAKEFSVELITGNLSDIRPRKRIGTDTIDPDTDTSLMVSIIVIRTLAGGLERVVDWAIVQTLFPYFSLNWLARYWTKQQQKSKTLIEQITKDFQETFPLAYERGEVPPINYNNLTKYDWASVVEWTKGKVGLTLKMIPIMSIPSTLEECEKIYQFNEDDDAEDIKRRECYYGLSTALKKRMEGISATPSTVPLTRKAVLTADEIKIDDMTLAKSWVRGVALTPNSDWDRRKAHEKLHQLGSSLVESALEELKTSKVVMHKGKGRAVPGRNYEVTDLFARTFKKHVKEDTFIQAAHFKAQLDYEFKSGARCHRSSVLANEGAILCCVELQAKGQLKLVGVDVPMNKFGLTGGGYETRKLDKAVFNFNVDLYPTDKYTFDQNNELLERIRSLKPPRGGPRCELPVWYNISGHLNIPIWKKTLSGIISTLALRSGSTVKGLKQAFHPTLEEWEVLRLIEWGEAFGLFERLKGGIDGWTVGPWWWLLGGRLLSSANGDDGAAL